MRTYVDPAGDIPAARVTSRICKSRTTMPARSRSRLQLAPPTRTRTRPLRRHRRRPRPFPGFAGAELRIESHVGAWRRTARSAGSTRSATSTSCRGSAFALPREATSFASPSTGTPRRHRRISLCRLRLGTGVRRRIFGRRPRAASGGVSGHDRARTHPPGRVGCETRARRQRASCPAIARVGRTGAVLGSGRVACQAMVAGLRLRVLGEGSSLVARTALADSEVGRKGVSSTARSGSWLRGGARRTSAAAFLTRVT